MSTYTLEVGESVIRLRCDCCCKQKQRVWGFVCNDGDAHAVYYALLNVEEERPRVGLTLSVGPWWDGSEPSQRSWVHLDVRSEEDGIQMSIRDPQESNYYPWDRGGTSLDREKAIASGVIEGIWPVADFIVEADPAVKSYLDGTGVNTNGRKERIGDNPIHHC